MPIDNKDEQSLQWIVERHARSSCLVNWSAGNVDAHYLSRRPGAVKELKLCGMPKVLTEKVRIVGTCNRYHWIHNFAGKLRSVEPLTLSGCGYDPLSLPRLRGWTSRLDIRVEERVEEESRGSD